MLATKLLKKTDFTFGARYDNNSYFGNAFCPRITAVNQLNQKLSFKLQFGTAFRSPTNLEIHQPPPTGSFKLKKEKLTTYEVNAIYSPSKNLRLQVNGFRNDLSDVIVLSNLPTPTLDKNPAIIHITGVEGILDWEVSKNISGFINFTWQDPWGKNLITGNSGRTPGVAKIKGNAGITCRVNDFLIITLSGNYVGDRSVPRSDPYGTVKGYFLANCNISTVKLFKEKITASLNIHNIFNTKWLDPGFRTADGLLYSTVLEQPGINGLFKIGITL